MDIRKNMSTKEILPDLDNHLGFLILLVVVLLHLKIAVFGPDSDGHLFSQDLFLEALGQSFLLCAPAIAVYAGLRAIRRDRDRLLPYLAVSGGGILGLLTFGALLVI